MTSPELSQRVVNMPLYPPREIEAIAREHKIDLKDCYPLHLGDTYYSSLPPQMSSAMKDAIDNNRVHYTASLGISDLKERIAGFYKEKYNVGVDPNQVIIDMGSTHGIANTSLMFLNPGDYALVVNPAYPAYLGAIGLAEGKVIQVPTKLENGFRLTDMNMHVYLKNVIKEKGIDLNKIKMMIFNNPNNPTGQYESIEGMRKLKKFAEKHGIIVLADEPYLELVFDPYEKNGDITSFLSITGTEEAIGMGTFSKLHAATGLRVAWRIIPKKFMEHVDKMQAQTFLSPPEPNQLAAIAAFDTSPEWYEKNLRLLKENRDLVLDYMRGTGIAIPENIVARAGLYQIIPVTQINYKKRGGKKGVVKADSKHMVINALLKKHILVTSGLGFGVGPEDDFIRISLCLPQDQLEGGLEKFVELLGEDYEIRDAA